MLEEAESALTGGISIEDVTLQEPGEPNTVVRRMVFTSNRNLVQSEAALIPSALASDTGSDQGLQQRLSGQAAAAGKKTKGRSSKAGKQKQANGADEAKDLVIDHSVLACDYHKGMIAGLSLIQPLLTAANSTTETSVGSQQTQQQQQQPREEQGQQQSHYDTVLSTAEQRRRSPRVMVVGLGGGGLPVYLNQFCGMDVFVVELDPVVVQLARRHFGFTDSTSLQVEMLSVPAECLTPPLDLYNGTFLDEAAVHWKQASGW